MMKLENVDKYYNINTSSEVHALKKIDQIGRAHV